MANYWCAVCGAWFDEDPHSMPGGEDCHAECCPICKQGVGLDLDEWDGDSGIRKCNYPHCDFYAYGGSTPTAWELHDHRNETHKETDD